MSRSSILLIYTGGTIGMVQDPETGLFKPFDFEHLTGNIPELKNFDLDIKTHSFENPIDSSDMHPEQWVQLAELIESNYSSVDGFVILHGSDTLAFTASALSFMLEGLNKPVILTGSQLPIGVVRTDGKENLITAIEIASLKENDQALVPEVAIYFEYKLYRGNRTFKFNAEHFDAFASPNYPVLAEAGVNIEFNKPYLRSVNNNEEFKVYKNLDTNIAILKLFPGIRIEAVEAILNIPGNRAVILETFGSGNAPLEPKFLEALKKALDRGILILNITQCKGGSVSQRRYETSIALDDMGVVEGKDLTVEAAVTKLMYLLGKRESMNVVKADLPRNLRGELTE